MCATNSGCSGLTSVTIPNSVTEIGEAAFSGCSALQKVNISSLESWCKIDFYDNPLSYAHNLYLNGSLVTDLVIPNSVTYIGRTAFHGCSGLTSVTIPNSVTSISDYAFSSCSGLTSVTIPNSVTEIGRYAFAWCSGLTSVNIGKSVTKIGGSAFKGCSALTTVNFNAVSCKEGYGFYDEDDWGDWTGGVNPWFENCPLTNINIGNNVTSIPSYFMCKQNRLTSIIIPNSVTEIGKLALYCSSLIDIHSKIKQPGEGVTYGTDIFNNTTTQKATLYIPKDTKTLYYNTAPWNKFANIVEEEADDPTSVTGDVNGDGEVNVKDLNMLINILLGI